jgi:ribosomal protein S18 acetylase RimI-like enzyme
VSGVTRPALQGDLYWVVPAAVRARLVADAAELAAISGSEPWRVRVTERGEAALLGRWREHTDDCAVLGLWCAPSRVPVLVGDLIEVARDFGFGRLLGPLIPASAARPYLDAGLRVVQRIVVLRLDRPGRLAVPELPARVLIREAVPGDLETIARIDRAAFDAFWRYDDAQLRRLMAEGRAALAEEDGAAIGYTLATISGAEGSVGRLAVTPGRRRRGVGAALAADAVRWLAGRGARAVTLSTQQDNEASLALYRNLGFRQLSEELVACASGRLEPRD